MARTLRSLVAVLVAVLVAWPALASAQATRRSGGGSSGGQGAGARSAPSQGSPAPRVAMPRSSGPRESPAPRTGGETSSRRPSGSEARVGDRGSASAPGQPGRVATGSTRTRGTRGIEGVAQARSYNGGYPGRPGYPAYPVHHYPYYGYGYGYPYYGSIGFGYPYYCCGSSFAFGVSFGFGWGYPYYGYPYGSWYGPGYWPYGPGYWAGPYAPAYVPVPYGVSVDDDRSEHRDSSSEQRPSGSLRFRASPAGARVYVDGALAGTVDDFDGLSNHLRLEAGRHHIELRADGYEPHATEVMVAAGRTLTTRANLKQTK